VTTAEMPSMSMRRVSNSRSMIVAFAMPPASRIVFRRPC